MTRWARLDALLTTDPRDVGCERAMAILHIYVDLALGDPVGAGARYPGVAAHLRACGPCGQDFEGLLAAAAAH